MDRPVERRFGLALSGGGFRAALFQSGVIRYLRDAGLLTQVSTNSRPSSYPKYSSRAIAAPAWRMGSHLGLAAARTLARSG